MSNFGAFDLSSLNKKQPPAPSGTVLAGWLVKANEQVLRQYVALSESTPVLMLISGSDQASENMRPLVEKAIASAAGRLAGIEIDLAANPELAQAVGITQAPALIAILGGQPAPIFQGEVSKDQLLGALSQVLQLATQNNLTGTVSVSGQAAEASTEPALPPLSPEHLAAIAAIEAGDLPTAKTIYEKISIANANDQEARAGLSQVELMIRMAEPKPTDPLGSAFRTADELLVQGSSSEAFATLLDLFAKDFENRDAIKDRLLALFTLVGQSEQSVVDARRRLASLMF